MEAGALSTISCFGNVWLPMEQDLKWMDTPAMQVGHIPILGLDLWEHGTRGTFPSQRGSMGWGDRIMLSRDGCMANSWRVRMGVGSSMGGYILGSREGWGTNKGTFPGVGSPSGTREDAGEPEPML
eukprot:750937-Hanusia_phi.AAC.3